MCTSFYHKTAYLCVQNIVSGYLLGQWCSRQLRCEANDTEEFIIKREIYCIGMYPVGNEHAVLIGKSSFRTLSGC